MLGNHTYTQTDGIFRRMNFSYLIVDANFTGISPVQAVQDSHQCGFTGAIFTQKGMNLSPDQIEIHLVACHEIAESFFDPFHLHSIHGRPQYLE